MKKQILLFNLIFFFLNISYGQVSNHVLSPTNELGKHNCGTPPPSAEEKKRLFKEVISKENERALQRNNVNDCLPIKVHIVRNTDGSGGLSLGDLAIAFANLNYVFYEASMEFFVCGDINYIDDSDFYDFDNSAPDNDDEATLTSGEEVTDAINVFFMNSITVEINGTPFSAAGFARFPNNTLASNRIFMINDVANNAPNSTFSHEFGHYFSLYHTHQDTEFGNTDPDAERVVRTGGNANCDTNGDLLCDTDADPRYASGDFDLSSCTYTGSGVDDLGVPYLPTSAINNIMSYYPDQCGGVFTPEQFTRMASGLATRQGYTNPVYNYSCTAATVSAASGMNATVNGNQIDLSWTDNANNELGYVIEKSTTSSSAGFLPIIYGGVAPNITSFADTDIASTTTYWYRVRPVNSACDNYSNVVSVTTGLAYCTPNFSTGCVQVVLEDFSLDGDASNDIDNNASGCSTNAYGNFTGQTADVTAGQSYTVEAGALAGTCFGNFFPAEMTIWADWNMDGDFDDTNERLLTGNNSLDPCFTGTISVPADAVTGTVTMRVVINNGSVPNDPCGSYSFGETEDYTLNVDGIGGLPITLTSFKGELREEAVALTWETESEIDNDFFSLERSRDGIHFEVISEINGAGTSTQSRFYNYTDLIPYEGLNYYRLMQTDFDGKTSFSKIISVNVNIQNTISTNVLPNPVQQDEITLIYNALNQGDVQMQIIDITGKIVRYQKWDIEKGKNSRNINISELNAGIYFLQTEQNSIIKTTRFVRL